MREYVEVSEYMYEYFYTGSGTGRVYTCMYMRTHAHTFEYMYLCVYAHRTKSFHSKSVPRARTLHSHYQHTKQGPVLSCAVTDD